MAASAGTVYAVGKSGRQYVIDAYLPDAVGGNVTFNMSGSAGTGTPTNFRAPEDLVITDISVVTGTTAVGLNIYVNQALINGSSIRYANHLNTLNNRPKLAIAVRGLDFVSAIQF